MERPCRTACQISLLLLMALARGVQDRHYVSEEYKKEVLEHMSIHQLIDTILINPTVHVSPSYRDTGLSASYTFKPLSNLVYTRDQQVIFQPSQSRLWPSSSVPAGLTRISEWLERDQVTMLVVNICLEL